MLKIKKISDFIRQTYLDFFVVIIIALIIFSYIQTPATLPDPDSFPSSAHLKFFPQKY